MGNDEENAYPGSGETLTLTERYTRLDADTVEYRYTVDDPAVYTRPYTVVHPLTRDDSFGISPQLCHENNLYVANVFANGRTDEWNSMANVADSVNERKARVEELKKEAMEAAKK